MIDNIQYKDYFPDAPHDGTRIKFWGKDESKKWSAWWLEDHWHWYDGAMDAINPEVRGWEIADHLGVPGPWIAKMNDRGEIDCQLTHRKITEEERKVLHSRDITYVYNYEDGSWVTYSRPSCPENMWKAGKFNPKVTDNLLNCFLPLIGRTFTWHCIGYGQDDEFYPGQSRWKIDEEHKDIPNQIRCWWVPQEDIEFV